MNTIGARAITVGAFLFAVVEAQPVFSQTAAQDERVNRLVAKYLDQAFLKKGDIGVGTRIQTALNAATRAREEPGRSSDELLRNAEYYLHGLYAAANRDVEHAAITAGAPAYEALKYIAFRLKKEGFPWLEKRLRTDADAPMSPPGGWQWAYQGLKDGSSIDGTKEIGARTGGHGLTLSLK